MNPQGLVGIAAILLLCWAVSEDRRRAFHPAAGRLICVGLVVHVGLALLLLKLPEAREVFLWLNHVVSAVDRATMAGTSFVFGYLGGGPPPFEARDGFSIGVLAFRFLPLLLVVSAISAVLFHWRVLPAIVWVFTFLLERSLGVRGALGLSAAANVFVGMLEAPLLVRPYLEKMRRAELFAMMTVGMATVAGTVMVLYATILSPSVPGALGHILTASVLNVPAAMIVCALLVPFAHEPATEGALVAEDPASNTMEALVRGVSDGIVLLINVVAMLLVFVALVALLNGAVGLLPDVGGRPLSLERVLGWLLAPLAWAIGIGWGDAGTAGQLLGTKIVLNELKAYLDLTALPETAIAERSRLILVYAMCGFANLGSLGIMIGGLAALAPGRRAEIAKMGAKSIAAGLMSTSLTASIVGLMI